MPTIALLAALALPIHAQAADGEALLRQMNAAHRDSWFRTMVFVQRTTFPAQPGRAEETWFETMERPGKLRIDMERGDSAIGTLLFRNDSIYQFNGGQLQRSAPLVHYLLVLAHDIHVMPSADDAIAKLRALNFNLATTHRTTWQGIPITVVGAAAGDTTSSQFWVDTDRLIMVRVMQTSPNGARSDVQVSGFTMEGPAAVERDIKFYTNGNLGMHEEYTWIRTGVELDPAVFDPARVASTRPAWIAEWKRRQ